jgi:hypothetical protein
MTEAVADFAVAFGVVGVAFAIAWAVRGVAGR